MKNKKRIKWPRTRLERYQQYGDMGSTERLRFSQTLGDSRGRLASVGSMQSMEHDDLSLAASAHGFYIKSKSVSPPKWGGSFGRELPLANNEDSWVERGTLNSIHTRQQSEQNHGDHQVHPSEREFDAADHQPGPAADMASPGNTSRVAFMFDDNPADQENYYIRQARINQKRYGYARPFLTMHDSQREDEPQLSSVPSPLDKPGAPRIRSLIYAGQEIASFMDLVWPFIGIFGYCLDVGSDVAVMLEYLIEELYVWFALTLVFVLLPAVSMTVLSLVLWVRNHKVLKEKVSPVQWTMRVTMSVILATPIMRLVDIFYYGWQSRNTTHDWYTRRMFFERMIDEETECTLVRLFETFLENAPQLVLQLYVLTVVGTTKGLVLVIFQVAGLVISWIQMSVSLVSFHAILRASLQPEKAHMSWGGKTCMFLWRLFTIASRVVALALFAAHFHFYVFVFVGAHFLIMFIWIINQESTYCQIRQRNADGNVVIHDSQVSEFFFRFVAAAVHVFCFMNLLEGPTRLRHALYYAVVFLENLTMVMLWYTFGGTVTETTWYHGPALAIVIGGFLIGIMFQVLYYKWFHPNNHNPAYSDRKIPWCRKCSEMSLIHNIGYKDQDSDDEEDDDEVFVVKKGSHIEPMSRPPTGQSNRELQPGYSGQVYQDDYREMMNYEPPQQQPKPQPRVYLEKFKSPTKNGEITPHHPLNNRRNSNFNPEDTPLPPSLSQQRQNGASRQQNNAPQQKQYSAPQQKQYDAPRQKQYDAPRQKQYDAPQQKQYNAPQQKQYGAPQQKQYGAPQQRQNSIPKPNNDSNRRSYLAVGRGRGRDRGRQLGQSDQQGPVIAIDKSPANISTVSYGVSKSTTV